MLPNETQYEITTRIDTDNELLAVAETSRELAYGDHSDTFWQASIEDIETQQIDDEHIVTYTVLISGTAATHEQFEQELTEFLRIVSDYSKKDQ